VQDDWLHWSPPFCPGLTWDSKDRLLMTSDTTGEIFVIGGI
jgi:hypothetical protein